MENVGRTALSLMLCTVSYISGCVSSHTLNYDDEISSDSSFTQACSYRWPGEITVFRRDRSLVETTGWDSNTYLGSNLDTDSIKREVASQCGNMSPSPKDEAIVVVYFLTYSNRTMRGGVTLPVFFLSMATLGLLPVPSADSVALCLDIGLPDGQHRYGFSRGGIVDIENMYGLGQELKKGAPPYSLERTELRQLEMLDSLLLRAFHKAWVPGQGGFAQPDCEAALNSIIE